MSDENSYGKHSLSAEQKQNEESIPHISTTDETHELGSKNGGHGWESIMSPEHT